MTADVFLIISDQFGGPGNAVGPRWSVSASRDNFPTNSLSSLDRISQIKFEGRGRSSSHMGRVRERKSIFGDAMADVGRCSALKIFTSPE